MGYDTILVKYKQIMKRIEMKMSKKIKIWLLAIVLGVLILCGAFYIYTLDYYRADDHAIEVVQESTNSIQMIDNMTVFHPSDIDESAGFIFYPGGKVEAAAYAPLLQSLSDEGITCVLVEMPMNLAVFDIDAADRVYEELPEISTWYLGGHSLGGAMASSYVEDNYDKLSGLILLGAYPINDADIETLAVYGSEDIMLDTQRLEGLVHTIRIDGGNHAYVGNYGDQKGDGTATITREEQQKITVDTISSFIFDQNK